MRALPLWQPWASLVSVEAKTIETRGSALPADLLGKRIAIHATKTKAHLHWSGTEPFRSALAAALNAGTLALIDDELPLGHLLCTLVVEACVQITPASARELRLTRPDEYAFGNYTPSRYAYHLTDVERLSAPVPFRAHQGMPAVPNELLGLPPAPEQGVLL